jgi:hypothetical protein
MVVARTPVSAGPAVVAPVAGSIVATPEPRIPSAHAGGDTPSPGRIDPGSTIGPTMSAVVQRVDGAAPPAPTEAAVGHSEDELDELARALFGRFRNRLRHEYIYEREAKGLAFDNN